MSSRSTGAKFTIWNADQTTQGPLDLPTLISWARSERITPETWIFVNKSCAWHRAIDVPELQWFFQVKQPQPPGGVDLLQKHKDFDPRALRRLKLFSVLSDAQLDRFAQYMEVRRAPLGSTIVKQG